MNAGETAVTSTRTQRQLRIALTAGVLGALLVIAGTTDAFGAARGTAFAPCLPASQPVTIHVTQITSPAPPGAGVSSYELSGFNTAGCDGASVVLTVLGNPAGDPSQPTTETLATYDSRLDPCTQQPLAQPLVIQNGSITINTCANSGIVGTASVHDFTELRLTVRGQVIPIGPPGPTVPTNPTSPTTPTGPTSPTGSTNGGNPTTSPTTAVLGETFTNPGGGSSGGHASVLATVTQLPFTGTYAALTFWIGVLLVIAGFALVLVARRRRQEQDPEGGALGGRHT